jgi:hypothetical protein
MAIQFGDERVPERIWKKIFPEPNTGCWNSMHCDDDMAIQGLDIKEKSC